MTIHKTFSAFTNDCIGTHDATELCDLIDRGEITVLEVTEAAIERAKRARPVIGGIACELYQEALDRLKKMPTGKNEGEFRHLPSFLKDNIDLAGTATGFGSRAMPNTIKEKSSVLAVQIQSVALNFIGKSATPPFGFGCSTEFEDNSAPTRNPWNLEHSAGGSSGGAAALVAAGVVPIAHANDGGGSIRIPAAMCGVVGLKPTRGRLVVQDKSKGMPINIISDGVITRTVRDTAKFYYAAEKVYLAPGLKQIGNVGGPSNRRLRIGFVYDSVLTKADEETKRTVLETVATLQILGHQVEQMPIPIVDSFADDFTLYWCLLAFSVDTFGRSVFGRAFDRSKLDPLTLGLSRQFKRNFLKLPGAIRRLKKSREDFAKRSLGFDAVLSPVIAKTTPKLGYLNPGVPYDELMPRLKSYVGYTPIANATGAPAISLPMGRSESGLPIGLQFSAGYGEERVLLELAYELEDARPWKQQFQINTRPGS